MNKVITPVIFILFAGMFILGISNDNSPKDGIELIMNIVVGLEFTLLGSWFTFFPKSVDMRNKKVHAAMYERTGIKLFKKLSESVDKNPVNRFDGRVVGVCCGLIGLALLLKTLSTLFNSALQCIAIFIQYLVEELFRL